MTNSKGAKSANIRVLEKGKLAPTQSVPKSLLDAAGILRDRYPDLKRHIRKVRAEWSKLK